jgi:hypothetical protein
MPDALREKIALLLTDPPGARPVISQDPLPRVVADKAGRTGFRPAGKLRAPGVAAG